MNKTKFIVVFSLLLLSAVSHAAVVWNGTSAAWTKGSGTEADPYLIETPKNLAYLAAQVNAGNTYAGMYFKQTDDFDMNKKSWTPIGTTTYPFQGTYDGENHSLNNFPDYSSHYKPAYYSQYESYYNREAIFLYIQDANIFHLDIYNIRLVDNAKGNSVIRDCHHLGEKFYINVYSHSGALPKVIYGGIVTSILEDANIIIENCSNQADISINFEGGGSGGWGGGTCTVNAGGIVGLNKGKLVIRNSFNIGLVETSVKSGSYATMAESWACAYCGKSTDECLIMKCYDKSFSRCLAHESVIFRQCYSFGLSGGGHIGFYDHCYMVMSGISFSSGSRAKDSYYNSTARRGESNLTYGLGWNPTQESLMKKQTFVDMLNEGMEDAFCMDYLGINDGYPILKWQLEGMTFYKLRATCQEVQGMVSGSGEYPENANITIKATPKDGFVFTGWSDGNTDNPRAVTVTGDATYVAQFSQSAYTIYVNQDCTTSVE